MSNRMCRPHTLATAVVTLPIDRTCVVNDSHILLTCSMVRGQTFLPTNTTHIDR
jgi:hypothetical protein